MSPSLKTMKKLTKKRNDPANASANSVCIRMGSTFIWIRLGDILVTGANRLYAQNRGDLDEFLPLALMPVAFRQPPVGSSYGPTIYFFMSSLYKYEVTVSKVEDDVVYVLKKGKEVKFDSQKIVESITSFADNYRSRVSIKGIDIYSRILISRVDQVKHMSLRPFNIRLADLYSWPRRAVAVWADKQLNLSGSCMRQKMEVINDKNEMVDMIWRTYITDKIVNDRLRELGIKDRAPLKASFHNTDPNRNDRLEHRRGTYRGMHYINLSAEEWRDGVNMNINGDLLPAMFAPYTVICKEAVPAYIITTRHGFMRISLKFPRNSYTISPINRAVDNYCRETFDILKSRMLAEAGRDDAENPPIDPHRPVPVPVTKYADASNAISSTPAATEYETGTINIDDCSASSPLPEGRPSPQLEDILEDRREDETIEEVGLISAEKLKKTRDRILKEFITGMNPTVEKSIGRENSIWATAKAKKKKKNDHI
jgi:hypothetical protein